MRSPHRFWNRIFGFKKGDKVFLLTKDEDGIRKERGIVLGKANPEMVERLMKSFGIPKTRLKRPYYMVTNLEENCTWFLDADSMERRK